ncbi:hypothetical protein BO86DRAFT_116946 [Aspergillus japonicus CBS 114.51]|uniref:Uncharacterized protein n=1 Tax=Aspergillus japonicus CBS 114.51 TaxID=1448312 RepID=A0A8T8XF54_ASPJA|nr:hypothetical protein BO86DRAFT_116946 [Aspergillus japonicus CBS 114.51]RAH86691.1 hypothetical protein BO86DRAFT_116946 [Aspergillus japonicus CBS 114.51]
MWRERPLLMEIVPECGSTIAALGNLNNTDSPTNQPTNQLFTPRRQQHEPNRHMATIKIAATLKSPLSPFIPPSRLPCCSQGLAVSRLPPNHEYPLVRGRRKSKNADNCAHVCVTLPAVHYCKAIPRYNNYMMRCQPARQQKQALLRSEDTTGCYCVVYFVN